MVLRIRHALFDDDLQLSTRKHLHESIYLLLHFARMSSKKVLDGHYDSSTDEWDFRSAIELIRLQTSSLIIRSETVCGYDPREPSPGHIAETKEISSRQLLGDFEEILKRYGRTAGKTSQVNDNSTTDSSQHDEIQYQEYDKLRSLQSPPSFHLIAHSEELSCGIQKRCRDDETSKQGSNSAASFQETTSGETDVYDSLVTSATVAEEGTSSRHVSEEEFIRLGPNECATRRRELERRKVIHGFMGISEDVRKASLNPRKLNSSIGRPAIHASKSLKTLSAPKKKLQIMQMLATYASFAVEQGLDDAHQRSLLESRSAKDGIHVFIDLSNILIGFHDALKRQRGIPKEHRIPRERLSFSSLALILERGRPVSKAVLAGSDELESVEEAREMGYEINLLTRVLKRKERSQNRKHTRRLKETESAESEPEGLGTDMRPVEQGVDEILHLKILESILDIEKPSVIVLATGDAAEAEYSDGFLRMLERALARNWKVELVTFRENMSAAYRARNWTKKWTGAFRIVELDAFAELLRLD